MGFATGTPAKADSARRLSTRNVGTVNEFPGECIHVPYQTCAASAVFL